MTSKHFGGALAAALLTAATVAAGAAPARAEPGAARASTTVQVEAVVPVLCRIELYEGLVPPRPDGLTSLSAETFCNAPRGYRLIVAHAAGLQGAALVTDRGRIPLSPTGETVLADHDGPGLGAVTVAIDPGQQPAMVAMLGVRIEAKT